MLARLSAMSPDQRRRMSLYERAMENFARTPAGDWYMKRIAPRVDPPLLRITGGRVSSVYPVPIMLLTTTGAKSGQQRTLPLLYLTDGEHLILIASNYGKTSHPAWYRNLTANPKVQVLAGSKSGTYTATEITDAAARDRAWDLALDMYAGYGDYEGRAGDRTIPLIRLERVSR
ncbi:nitroreductase family deazaflavin-dependent oxidoreductase [Mycolicibacterium moriokaense]|nr:nitroreductase family deazaflavin-dependent oxidoreductase [Mycolicibacterium moriokaense]